MELLGWVGAIAVLVTVMFFCLGYAAYRKGKTLEREGNFKLACYRYAEALRNFPMRPARERIQRLWQEHGPFEYADLTTKVEQACEQKGCDDETRFHEAVLELLNSVVSDKGR